MRARLRKRIDSYHAFRDEGFGPIMAFVFATRGPWFRKWKP